MVQAGMPIFFLVWPHISQCAILRTHHPSTDASTTHATDCWIATRKRILGRGSSGLVLRGSLDREPRTPRCCPGKIKRYKDLTGFFPHVYRLQELTPAITKGERAGRPRTCVKGRARMLFCVGVVFCGGHIALFSMNAGWPVNYVRTCGSRSIAAKLLYGPANMSVWPLSWCPFRSALAQTQGIRIPTEQRMTRRCHERRNLESCFSWHACKHLQASPHLGEEEEGERERR